MKQAICIQAHSHPELLNALISNPEYKDFDFYIHIDKKSNILEIIKTGQNVFFTPRVEVKWGQFSQVESTLKILESIPLEKYTYIHIISGTDCPIKTPKQFLDYFGNSDLEYIESFPIGPGSNCFWKRKGEDRYAVYYPQFIIKRPTNKLTNFIRGVYKTAIMKTKVFKRTKFPVDKFYGGSNWFSITPNCAKWMIEYLKTHPGYIQFFKHTMNSDELFFSTLIQLSPYRSKIANNNLRFIEWDHTLGTGGPKEVSISDIGKLQNSEAFFTRKVSDLATFETILKKLSCEEV